MVGTVKPKKSLGQHFLTDRNIAARIAAAIEDTTIPLLEIGPGMGMLTGFLLRRPNPLKVIEIDPEAAAYLGVHFPDLLPDRLIVGDFLKSDLEDLFQEPFAIVGNFPYNISSQILFRLVENHAKIPVLCGMFQKEVALRIASDHGSKQYGILSVLCQTYYDVKLLFSVSEKVFNPPPNVQSAVIMLTRKADTPEIPDEKLYIRIVKAAFNQRRKMLRNALGSAFQQQLRFSFEELRAEQLSVSDFMKLYHEIER